MTGFLLMCKPGLSIKKMKYVENEELEDVLLIS